MGLQGLDLLRSYDSGEMGRSVLTSFYVPALSASLSYDRIAGFFSSTSLAVAARGISGLLENGGRIRLICSPRLSSADAVALAELSRESLGERLGEFMLQALDFDTLGDILARDHVRAMCWMLRNGTLEMRVAVPAAADGSGLFHQKIGILRDASGNEVSFSGSMNETASGWLDNLEHFKVFRSWEAVEAAYVADDVSLFERYWNDDVPGARVMSVPEAVSRKLLEYAPDSLSELRLEAYSPASAVSSCPVGLWEHQLRAVDAWLESGCRKLLQMATGTGKTVTALECARRYSEANPHTLLVISVPYQHLATQWMRDVTRFFPGVPTVVAHGGNAKWRSSVLECASRVASGTRRVGVVVAVQNTAAGDDFLSAVELVGRSPIAEAMLIGDEVHGLGASRLRAALSSSYTARLGLSATPYRWFDDEGTAVLEDYFGHEPYSFMIEEALRTVIPGTSLTILTPYTYKPLFVSLEDDELDDYVALTKKAAQAGWASGGSDGDKSFDERFLFMRASVVKCARQKLNALDDVLQELGPDVTRLIIYCFDRQQMLAVEQVLAGRCLVFSEFTGAEGTKPEARYGGMSEREFLLEKFGSGDIPVLIAMKCLDAGVDVPSARVGLILASSTNPTEFIQRRGRLLRRAPGKHRAVIYDVLVRPGLGESGDAQLRDVEIRLFRKELERLNEFASTAENGAEVHARVLGELGQLLD
ncbi:MAG: DEAD/DEAH box helicase family protein [Coriobacteriia bacterium]|nr:DEAD/DEAH box helicase family protein [Coriobacteriia bacterium]